MTYFNTTNQDGDQLRLFTGKAKTQDQMILSWFKRNPNIRLRPSEVLRIVFDDIPPLTSVRRSLTVLTDAGHLVRADRVDGPLGRPVHRWRLA